MEVNIHEAKTHLSRLLEREMGFGLVDIDFHGAIIA